MKTLLFAAFASSFALTQPLFAAEAAKGGEAAAKQAGCLNCHNVDSKKVGPSLKDVASKHKSGSDVIAAAKAKPVHQSVLKSAKEPDLKAAADWISSLK